MKKLNPLWVAAYAAAMSLAADAIEFAEPRNVPRLFDPYSMNPTKWTAERRPELKKMLETEVYGHRPVERPPHLAFSTV